MPVTTPLRQPNQRKKQAGVGLIEVLLAVVILSIGFLAAAQMQIEGMQANQAALFSSQANFMLRDMTDRMRANPQGVSNGDYDTMDTTNTVTLPTCITSQSPCSPADIAAADLYNWRSKFYAPPGSTNFVASLPSSANIAARGDISYDLANNTYTLTMYWSESDDDGVAQEQQLQVLFTP